MSASAALPLLFAIRQLAMGSSLTESESRAAFDAVMSGEATPAQLAALLVGLRVKGETVEEVAGAAGALRGAMVRLDVDRPDELVDTCGTGGGAIGTFNISTAAALLAAGLGVRVAKHGNRSFTSQCGSADVLEALGVPIDVGVDVMARALREAGIVFMFAPLMHPAMRHVGSVRRELAIPTVMNIVGPLANPASAGRQVVGVADARRVPLLAGALRILGTRRALVVHGEPGMDEISPLGSTHVVEIREHETREWTIDPARYGLPAGRAEELRGGPPVANADAVLAVMENRAPPTATAAVILNAGAALYVAPDGPTDFGDAIATARDGLKDGAGLRALERLRAAHGRPR
ncbi:MAG: anthranilate phosphoribosyltransferase [Gemmatimonadaceae bacterium]|nr:anthranilate phosphoribosyltransferase [Gemmatimonadaceae bacterium]